ncbi:ABC transporter ATP-binding protein [bacterium]|nr:ABC transporter ATP-binding protein [bacterium]
MKTFKRLFKYFRKYKWYYFLGFVCLIGVDGLQVIVPKYILKPAINNMVYGVATPSGLLRYGIYIMLIAIGIALTRFSWRYCIMGNAWRIERNIRNDFFEHLLNLSFNYYNNTKTGELMAKATNDLRAVRMSVGITIVAAFDSLFFSTISLIMLFSENVRLTLYVLIPMPILVITALKFGGLLHNRFEQVQEMFASISAKVQEIFSGIRVIKAYVQEDAELKGMKAISNDYVDKNMTLVKIWGLFGPLISLLVGLCMAIILIIGGRKVIYNEMTMGSFVAFNSYLHMLVWPMMAIGWVINLYQRGRASMGRLNQVFDTEPDITDAPDAYNVEKLNGNISIKNLGFAYDFNKEPVLNNINMEIKKNETIAIIGKTGSGKSTLVNLLLRLFEVKHGEILMDGYDIKKIPLKTLRRNIGYVPQDTFLFSDTVSENIAFGKEASEEEIIQAAKMAQVYDEVMEFPEGFDSMVGEKGVTLSGGQKQRVAIARAILINPSILILDDALSSVDTETEEQILKNLKEIRKKTTTILISHRISTVQDADKIFVLDGGSIAESGVHEELLKKEGIYYDIFKRQQLEEMIESI